MSLSDLYQEIILDHYKNPRNYGDMDEPHVHAEDNNPSCGDELELSFNLNEDQDTVEELKFEGQGCAISMASASLMSDKIEGMTLDEIEELHDRFETMLTDEETDAEELSDELGDLVALEGVIKFPIRIKCASLAWDTLHKGLEALEEDGIPARVIQNE